MIYESPILMTHDVNTAILRYSSHGWEFGLAPRIETRCPQFKPIMIDHHDVNTRPDKYYSMDKAMRYVINELNFCTNCRINGEVCEVYNRQTLPEASATKWLRLCTKYVPRNIPQHEHEFVNISHDYHEHGCTGRVTMNNDRCTVCHLKTTWISKEDILSQYDEEREKRRAQVARNWTYYDTGVVDLANETLIWQNIAPVWNH